MLRRKDWRLSSILNKRIELWTTEKSTEKNRLGQYPIVDKCIGTYWGGVIPTTGSLLNGRTGDTALVKTTHKIILRNVVKIEPKMWFMYDGVRYNVIYAMDSNLDHERLEVFCEVLV